MAKNPAKPGKKKVGAPGENGVGVIYARYSSHAQKDASIEQQVKEAADYAREAGIQIVEIYADRAVSGKADRRASFQRMMKDAEKGKSNISLRERIRLNLIDAMEKAGLNQVEMAEKLNISKGTVNNWIRGNNAPDVDTVPRICAVLGISITDFYAPAPIEADYFENQSKKSPSFEENGLDEQSSRIMNLLQSLSDDQKDFLIALLETIISRVQQTPPADRALAGRKAQ